MIKVNCIIDYKGKFESKVPSKPYNTGFDKDLLKKYCHQFGMEINYLNFSDIDFKNNYENDIFVYTSSEDYGLYYKSYIEDVIFGLEEAGALVIPKAKYLRAHHNKVYMEILRSIILQDTSINSKHFGTLEELLANEKSLNYPLVVKPAIGSSSRGVGLVQNKSELIKHVKKISQINDYIGILQDYGLYIKKKLQRDIYKRDSIYKRKFIIQNFIKGLSNDWKVLIYGDKYYVLKRKNSKNDFRASGSGLFEIGEIKNIPDGLFDYAKRIYKKLNVPQLSIDIAFDGKQFYMIEFQALSFGTLTQTIAPHYFKQVNDEWEEINEIHDLEEVYAMSLYQFLKNEE